MHAKGKVSDFMEFWDGFCGCKFDSRFFVDFVKTQKNNAYYEKISVKNCQVYEILTGVSA